MTRSAITRLNGVADTLAVGWLICLGMLLAWSMLPLALGWRPHVVLTPSMAPGISPGDVVLSAPATRIIKRGTVVVVRDNEVSSGQVMHRVMGTDAVGRLITKGDANQSQDSTHRSRSDVLGVGRLVIPGIGRAVLLRDGRAAGADWIWAGLTVVACVWVARPTAAYQPRHA